MRDAEMGLFHGDNGLYAGRRGLYAGPKYQSGDFELSLPGLLAWWSPRDASTVTLTGTPADDVSRIDDKSGNGHHMVQATEFQRPQYPVTIGESVGFHPDTNDMHLENGTVSTGTAQTVAVVLQPTEFQGHASLGTGPVNKNGARFQFGIRSDGTSQFAISDGCGGRDVIAAADDPTSTYAANDILICLCTWTTSSMVLRINGHIVTRAATRNPSRIGSFALGAATADEVSFDHTGETGDVLVCDLLSIDNHASLMADRRVCME